MVPVNSAPPCFPPLPAALRRLWGGGIFCCNGKDNPVLPAVMPGGCRLACVER
nr:MAG TPA: hypothetical protein [Caudoviricetes sp.]